MDTRSRNYFDAILENIGYVKYDFSGDSIADKEGCTHICRLEKRNTLGYYRDTEIDLYEVDGYYVVEKFEVYPPDDYGYVRTYFKKKPTLNDYKSWERVDRAKWTISNMGYEFVCWECGNKVHWLDGTGSLEERIDNFKEGYCGC